jgi:hypothetical protein
MRVYALVSLGLSAAASVLLAQQPSPIATEAVHPSISVSQQPVSPANSYHRVLAIVPLTGSGTHDDPVRPMFAPAPSAAAPNRSGIIAWQHQISDDGTLAIVEYVAPTRAAFAALFASTDSRVKVFEVGLHTQAEMQAAFQQVKASFSFTNFRPLPVQ